MSMLVFVSSIPLLASCLTYATPVFADSSRIDVSVDAGNNVKIEADTHAVKIFSGTPMIEYSVSGLPVSRFTCSLSSLVEFEDKDGDGRLEKGEVARRLNLLDLPWNFVSQSTRKGDNTFITLTYTFRNSTYDLLMLLNVYESPVTKVFTVADENITYFVDGNAGEVKLDVAVRDWPWSTGDTRLALRMRVSASSFSNVSEPGDLSEHEGGVSFEAGAQAVMVKWVKEARIKLRGVEDERIAAVTVQSSLADEESLELDFVYPNFRGGSLVHDPSVALGALWTVQPTLSMLVVSMGSGAIATGLMLTAHYLDREGSSTDSHPSARGRRLSGGRSVPGLYLKKLSSPRRSG